mmetsp:Transcript_24391/g.61913  ORF Transcript_24391/g.61913 Transcript_24391/m.61913 type:complete len:232 (-) Transcript_24391:237-932(-)
MLPSEGEDLVDPLRVAGRRHDPLEPLPAVAVDRVGVWRTGSWQVDQVPVAQGQAHYVEAERGHALEVLLLDVQVEIGAHALGRVIRGPDVAQAGLPDLLAVHAIGPHDAIEQLLDPGRDQVVLRDEAAAVVDALELVRGARLAEAALRLHEVAPDVAHRVLLQRVASLVEFLPHVVAGYRLSELLLARVIAILGLRDGEDPVVAEVRSAPGTAAGHIDMLVEPLRAEGAAL